MTIEESLLRIAYALCDELEKAKARIAKLEGELMLSRLPSRQAILGFVNPEYQKTLATIEHERLNARIVELEKDAKDYAELNCRFMVLQAEFNAMADTEVIVDDGGRDPGVQPAASGSRDLPEDQDAYEAALQKYRNKKEAHDVFMPASWFDIKVGAVLLWANNGKAIWHVVSVDDGSIANGTGPSAIIRSDDDDELIIDSADGWLVRL